MSDTRNYTLITALFVAVLIISEVAATKIAAIGPFTLPGATFLFPLSYIFGDVLTEVYGYRASRRVVWTGFFCTALAALLSTLMKNASALLYPSWYEGYGLPLHEAAAHGTPIIASTSGALPETAPPGTHFVPPFKPHLWTQAMQSVLENPKHPNLAPPHQTWDEAAGIIKNTLQSLIT
jgi:glycosyltransferase involved in cell wall biosynthesis